MLESISSMKQNTYSFTFAYDTNAEFRQTGSALGEVRLVGFCEELSHSAASLRKPRLFLAQKKRSDRNKHRLLA